MKKSLVFLAFLLAGCYSHTSSIPVAGSILQMSVDAQRNHWDVVNLNPDSAPEGMALGSDMALWFVEQAGLSIDRMDPVSKTVTRYPLPPQSPNPTPQYIVAGPDGNLWFTEGMVDKVGRISTQGQITEFKVPSQGFLGQVVVGPNQSLWFVDYSGQIGEMDLQGNVQEFKIPSGATPMFLAHGADDRIWFTEPNADQIGAVDAFGKVTEYPLPKGRKAPLGIVAARDGNLWFAESAANQIASISTKGDVIEYPIQEVNPGLMMLGPGGWPWLTVGASGGKIAKWNVNLHTLTILGWPHGVKTGSGIGAAGPDGNFYVSAVTAGAVVERMVK